MFQKSFWEKGPNQVLFQEQAEKLPYPQGCKELAERDQIIRTHFPCAGPSHQQGWISEFGKLLDNNEKAADVFKSFVCCMSDERFHSH